MKPGKFAVFTCSLLVFALWGVRPTHAASTALGDLAASMQPGTWAQLAQTNINSVVGQGTVGGNQIPFSIKGAWDSTRQILHFTGGDHHDLNLHYMTYTAATNSWTLVGNAPLTISHGYDHNTVDPNTGTLYVREYALGGTWHIWEYPVGGPWSVATTYNQGYQEVGIGTAWWSGSITGGGSNGTYMVYNCGEPNGQVALWNSATNTWFANLTGFGGTSTYHCFAEYSTVYNVAIFGGGDLNPRKVWRLNPDQTITAMPDAPVDLGVQKANITVDPVTGNFLIMGFGQLWEYDPRGSGTWTIQSGARVPPSDIGNPGNPNFDSVISAPIANYGVVTYITCRGGNCNMYLYKHADEFQTLCGRPGVIKCVGFDTAADLNGTYGDNSGVLPDATGTITPQIDSLVKASGNGSVKFTIPSMSGANSAGEYFTNFSTDLSTQFGGNSDFYVQWHQRFSPEFVGTIYAGGGGWKQAIIGTGDKPGCSASNSANGQCYSSCSTLETVTQNTFTRGFAQMYNSCTGSSSHGPFDPFEQRFGTTDLKLQNAQPLPYCLYSQGQTTPISFFPPTGNCFGYFPNEWMTFQVHIKTGPRVNDEFINSYVQLWLAREGQPGQLVLNWGPYNLSAGDPAINQQYGKVWLLPYNTNKDPSVSYPVAYTWYDDLIISTQPIAMLIGAPPPDTTAPSITNVAASGITSSMATITWTTDEIADSQVDYGTTSSYGQTTLLGASLVTSHSVQISGLAANTTYHYSAKSKDAASNLATSQDFTFATAPATLVISGVGTSTITSSTATITWTTNQPGDSQVDYGATSSYGQTTSLDALLVTAHSESLSGLAASTTYHYRVKSHDAGGTLTTSQDFTFTTAAPVISAVATSTITSSSVTITWTTVVPADSQVDYGATPSYGQTTPLAALLVTAHSVSPSGLAAGTTYHYRVKSHDVGGNLFTSQDFTFATLALPVISAVTAATITSLDAAITWTTDQASDSQVEYGVSLSYGNQTTLNSSLLTSHTALISGLAPGTVYHYRVKSRDSGGNIVTSSDYSFTSVALASPSTNGLIGYWAFNETSGNTTADSSGNNNNGTLWANISPIRTAGRVVNALQFNATDGDNNYNDDPRVTIGRNFDIANLPFTLAAWVNPVNYADWRVILSKRDSFLSSQERVDWGLTVGSGFVYLAQFSSRVTFTYSPPVNTWTHIAVVAGATDTKLYVNGILTGTISAFSLGTGAAANTVIGGLGEPAGGDPFSGMIDELRVYNRAISVVEVQQLYEFAGPSVTNVNSSNITNNGATITWTTDESTDSQVYYGATSSYGQTTALNPSLVTGHSVTLSGLSANTTYHFMVQSKDSALNLATSSDGIFATMAPPVITLAPAALPDGQAGVAYSQTNVASGGFFPYTFNVVAGALPSGLTLNSSTGAITGTPITLGAATFTVQAMDTAGNTVSQPYTVNISNVISSNVSVGFASQTFNSAPFPGFEGRLTINLGLTNIGPAINSPIFLKVTDLHKTFGDLAPTQPDVLLSADNGFGITGDVQTLSATSLGPNQSTPVSLLVGIGSRQTFTLSVDVYTFVAGSPVTSLDGTVGKSIAKAVPDTALSKRIVLVGRFHLEVSEETLDAIAISDRFRSARISSSLSSGSADSNVGVITGPGAQSRPSLAIDPILPTHMAVASNDYASKTLRLSTTQDGGRTWQSATLSKTVLNQTFFSAQDPSIAFDSLGRLSVVYTLSNLNDSANAIVLSESSDGINFNPPSAISFHPASDPIIDSRPVIAIRAGVGRYVAWDSLSTVTFRYGINVVRSDEGGLFGPVTTVISNSLVSSPALALGSSTVYLGWDEWGFNSARPYQTGGRLMITSSPAGAPFNFASPQAVAGTSIGFSQRIPAMPEVGVGPDLSIALDPNVDSVVHAVFTDKGNGMDIRYGRSVDSGRTWQTTTVNNDGTLADQFTPAIALDSSGNLNIAFYDTRLSSTFEAADVFLAQPSNSAFSNQRISTASSNDSRKNPLRDYTADLGDRLAIGTSAGNGVIAWTDTRLGSEDVFVSMVQNSAPAVAIITWQNPAPITYGIPLGSAQLNASASTPGTFVYSLLPGTILHAGVQTLSVTFTPSDVVHFTSASAQVQINVLPAPLNVTAYSASRVYGSPNPPLSGSIVGLVNGDNITATYATSATIGSAVGGYSVTTGIIDPNGRLSNYTLTATNAVLTIVPAPLTVTANSTSRFYGSPNPLLKGSIDGLINGDNITATYTTGATIQSMPGNYPIIPAIIDPNSRLSNYTVKAINGALTVVAVPIITLTSASTAAAPSPSLQTLNISFGPQELLSKSQTVSINLGNIGTADLAITGIGVTGANAADFTVVIPDNCSTVHVGANCPVSVTFTPTVLGSRTGLITVTDNTGGYAGSQQVVNLDGSGVLSYAVYARNTGCAAIVASDNALVDGNIAVNGNVTLSGAASVNGTIWALNPTVGTKSENHGLGIDVPCRNGSPGITISGKAKVTGGYAKLPAPVAFTVPPAVTAGVSDVNVKSNITLPPGKYRDVSVVAGATVTLLSGSYDINALKLSDDAKIALAGPVILNVAGVDNSSPLDFSGGSVTSSSRKPSDLLIMYSGGGKIEATGQTDSYGIIYAPNAQVRLSGPGYWYGALVVKTLEASGNGGIHYDHSLATQ